MLQLTDSLWEINKNSLPTDKSGSVFYKKALLAGQDYLFDAFSLSEAVAMLLRGDGNCAEVQWQFLGLSMPAWVLIAFVGFTIVGLTQLWRKA